MNIDESPNEITGNYNNYFLVIISYDNIIEAIKKKDTPKTKPNEIFVSITKKVLLLFL
jgi:hypothetical protein